MSSVDEARWHVSRNPTAIRKVWRLAEKLVNLPFVKGHKKVQGSLLSTL